MWEVLEGGERSGWEKYREREKDKGSISSSKVPWGGLDYCAWLGVPTAPAPYWLVHVAQAQGRGND